jgi:hypothetical protein
MEAMKVMDLMKEARESAILLSSLLLAISTPAREYL